MVETVHSKDEIIAAFKRLNADDQLVVYLALREFVPGADRDDDLELEPNDEFKAELIERHRQMLENPSANFTAEQVVTKLRERHGSRR